MNKRLRFGLWLSLPLFFTAKLWVPACQVIAKHNAFLEASMVLSLGFSLMTALVCERWLSAGILKGMDGGLRLLRSRAIFFGVLFLAVLLMTLRLVNQKVLHAFLNSADEHSCYFLAECLRMGKLMVKPHVLSEFFNVVHVGNRDGKWFSVYPPGWPLIWALGLNWNMVDWLNPAMTVLALSLIFLSGRRLFGTLAAGAGLGLTAFSPFFIFTGASYYSHATCLLMMAAFLYFFLRWQDAASERGRMLWASLAAAACGYGLMTRYLTMAAFAAPFWIYHYLPLFRRKRVWKKSDWMAPAISLVFILLIFYLNYAVTGKPFKAPNKYDKSWERLGFHRGDYTPVDGIVFFLARFFYLMDWFAPGLVVLFLAGFFMKRPGEVVLSKLNRWVFFYIAGAYFFYFSWGGNQYGPRYYWEGFPWLGLALGDTLRRLWLSKNDALKKFTAGLVAASLAAGGYAFWKQTEYVETYSRERKALYTAAEKTLHQPSIVFIHGFLGDRLVISEEDAVRNSPRLDGLILYAHDLGEKNSRLMQAFPGREYYRGTFDRKIKQAVLKKIEPGTVENIF